MGTHAIGASTRSDEDVYPMQGRSDITGEQYEEEVECT